MSRLTFSGHESFQCRNLWLKKGFKFLRDKKKFSDDSAIVDLGVGKSMVASIRYWYNAFGFNSDEDENSLAFKIFNESGYDPYLEDVGSLWLLHYELVANNKASIYNLFFNHFRKIRLEFSREHLIRYLVAQCEARGEKHSENTIQTDIGVLLKTYLRPGSKISDNELEDSYSSLLIELDLIKPMSDRKDWYTCRNTNRTSLPTEIVLYTILKNYYGPESKSVSFNKLLNGENSPGVVFALDADSLLGYIKQIVDQNNEFVFKDDAGIKELQLNREIDSIKVLEEYYGN